MKITGSLHVVVSVLLIGVSESLWRDLGLTVGPIRDEKGIYVYQNHTSTGVDSQHCRYCPKGAFKDTAANIRTQEPSCIAKYDDIKKEIKAVERDNNKVPICKVGDVPGCGPPPEENKAEGNTWSCDPGYSNVNYSVYFSCALISEKSRVAAWSYYCNEDLQWELDTSIPQVGTSMESTADDYALVPTDPLDDALKTLLLVASIFGTFGVVCLVVFAVWICHKRRENDLRTLAYSDGETVLFLASSGAGSGSPDCHAETGSDSGISDGSEDRYKKEMTSNERQPPYGEERPQSRGSNRDVEDRTSHKSQSSLESHRTEVCTHFHPQSSSSSCQMNTQSHVLSGEIDNSHMPQSNIECEKMMVRGEFQQSYENARKCQCLLFQKPSNQHGKSSLDTEKVPQMKPLNYLDVSNDINNPGDRVQSGLCEGISGNERPNPPGNVSANTYVESGYFEDENDKRHNTKRKEVAGIGPDVEGQGCSMCEENGHTSYLDKKGANFESEEQNRSQCECRSVTDSTRDLNNGSNGNEHREDLNEDTDESFEIEPGQCWR